MTDDLYQDVTQPDTEAIPVAELPDAPPSAPEVDENALTPRQKALRDGVGMPPSTRKMDRLVKLEQDQSARQQKLYELIRLRDHVLDAPGISPEVITAVVSRINGWIDDAEGMVAAARIDIEAMRKVTL